MKRDFFLLGIAALIIVGLVAFACLHGADLRVLNPQGPIGTQERWVIGMTVLLSSFVVIPVFFILFFFAWKYRAGNLKAKRDHAPNWDHDSATAEFVWWLGPTVIVLFLSIIAWKTSYALDPFKAVPGPVPPMTIEVVALDWKWLFIYPAQGIATVNFVEFPANTPIRFEITSDAPMNSFWIPSLGGQIMAMPGMTTQMNLLANKSGTYNGFSANISGDGFAGMAFTAKSVSQSDFTTWVNWVEGKNTPLTPATYADLAKPSEYNPISYYSSVQGDLYTASVMKYMMAPMTSTPAAAAPTASDSMPGMSM